MTKDPYSNVSKLLLEHGIKKAVFTLYDKNSLLSAKMICKLLNLPYTKYKCYIWQLHHKWKYLPRNERGSKCSSRHGWRGWTFLPRVVVEDVGWHVRLREEALRVGWVQSKSRNGFLFFRRVGFGRLQWFRSGRVNVYVVSPGSLGRAKQLVCDGFGETDLVGEWKLLREMVDGVRLKSQHYVFDVGERLPNVTIDVFNRSNGFVFKSGDRSHPTGFEFIVSLPDFVERNERVLNRFSEVLAGFVELFGGGGSGKREFKDCNGFVI